MDCGQVFAPLLFIFALIPKTMNSEIKELRN